MMTIARGRRPEVTFACVDCAIPVTASYGVPSGIIGLRCYPCARQAWRNGLADYPQPKVRCQQCGNPLPRSHIPAPSGGCSPDCPHMAPFCSAFCSLYASLYIRPAAPAGRAPVCPSPLGWHERRKRPAHAAVLVWGHIGALCNAELGLTTAPGRIALRR